MRKITHLSLISVLLLITRLCGAQQPAAARLAPSLEVTYDHTFSNLVPQGCGCFGLNGAGVEIVVPLKASHTSIVGGVDGVYSGGIGSSNLDLTLLTYTAGARYTFSQLRSRFQPYGEVQVGGAHASGSLTGTTSTQTGLRWAPAVTAGGGVNFGLSKHVAIKLVDARYGATTFANGGSDHQNDFRIVAGLVYFFTHP